MNCKMHAKHIDPGANPYTANIERLGIENTNFRTTAWTGCHLQMTLMSIPPCGEIGLEIHQDTDQFIRVEYGKGFITMGECKHHLDYKQNICRGDTVFIPAGTWHNVTNVGRNHLKVSVTYAPPNHKKGTIHRTKADADKEEHEY